MPRSLPHTPIANLDTLDRPGCQALWLRLFDTAFPKRLSLSIARPILAYEIQARQSRGLDRQTKAKLRAHARGTARPKAPGLQPGSQLVREWNGTTHHVSVTDTGFSWNGQSWRSLSAIARAITGTRWSGPRFFGLDG